MLRGTIRRLTIVGDILSAFPPGSLSACRSLLELDVTVPKSGVGWLVSLDGPAFVASLAGLTALRSLRFDNLASSNTLSVAPLRGLTALTRLDLPTGIELSEVVHLPPAVTALRRDVYHPSSSAPAKSDLAASVLDLVARPLTELAVSLSLLRLLLSHADAPERSNPNTTRWHALTTLAVDGDIRESDTLPARLPELDALCPLLTALDFRPQMPSGAWSRDPLRAVLRRPSGTHGVVRASPLEPSGRRILGNLRRLAYTVGASAAAGVAAAGVLCVHTHFAQPLLSVSCLRELCLPHCGLTASDLRPILRVDGLRPVVLDLSDNAALYDLDVLADPEHAAFTERLETLVLARCTGLGARDPTRPAVEAVAVAEAEIRDAPDIVAAVAANALRFLVSRNLGALLGLDLTGCRHLADVSMLGIGGTLRALERLKLAECVGIGRHTLLPGRGCLPGLRSIDMVNVPMVGATAHLLKARFPRLSCARLGRTPTDWGPFDTVQTLTWSSASCDDAPFVERAPRLHSTSEDNFILRGRE